MSARSASVRQVTFEPQNAVSYTRAWRGCRPVHCKVFSVVPSLCPVSLSRLLKIFFKSFLKSTCFNPTITACEVCEVCDAVMNTRVNDAKDRQTDATCARRGPR